MDNPSNDRTETTIIRYGVTKHTTNRGIIHTLITVLQTRLTSCFSIWSNFIQILIVVSQKSVFNNRAHTPWPLMVLWIRIQGLSVSVQPWFGVVICVRLIFWNENDVIDFFLREVPILLVHSIWLQLLHVVGWMLNWLEWWNDVGSASGPWWWWFRSFEFCSTLKLGRRG